MSLVFTLLGCADRVTEIAYPVMTLSETALDFGTVAVGDSATRTVILGNAGGMPMGFGASLGEGELGFTVDWGDCVASCPDGEAKGYGDTNPPESPTVTGGCLNTDRAVLPPGCQIPFDVTYTPTEERRAYDAVRVSSRWGEFPPDSAADPLPDYAADPIHTYQEVFLSADGPDLEPRPDVQVVGKVVTMERSGFLEGETLALSAQVVADGTPTYTWTVTAGTLDDAHAANPVFTAPSIEPDEANQFRDVTIYVVTLLDGYQSWGFGRFRAWDERTELSEPYVQVESRCAAAPGGAWAWVLGLLAVWRRRGLP